MRKKQKWNKNLEELCWSNFMETGEIGYYLLYKDLKREENERNKNKSTCDKTDGLPRK